MGDPSGEPRDDTENTMPKTRLQKEEQVQELTEALAGSKGVVFANFKGITVDDTTKLRRKCQEVGVRYVVAKKTLLGRALKGAGFDTDARTLEGSVGVAIADDEVAPAKVISEFGKDRDGFKLLGGLLEKKFIDGTMVGALAKLPSKQQLLGQLVGTLQAPISGFVRTLSGIYTCFVRVLAAVKDQKGA